MVRDEIYELFGEIKLHYPNFDISEEAVDRHWEFLSDMPLEVALRNVRMHVKDSVYPPKIAEIRAGWHHDDGGEDMKRAAQRVFDLQDELKKAAVPPPPGTRERIYAAIRAAAERNRTTE